MLFEDVVVDGSVRLLFSIGLISQKDCERNSDVRVNSQIDRTKSSKNVVVNFCDW